MHNKECDIKTTLSYVSRRLLTTIVCAAIVLGMLPISAFASETATDYSDKSNWAYYKMSAETLAGEDLSASLSKYADCFLVCPTVYMGDADHLNMSLQDEKTKSKFVGALNMEAGIYMDTCRMYAPYYRMMSMYCYSVDKAAEDEGTALGSTQHAGYINGNANLAYSDVKASFEYYLENENTGRPIVLAGFSQGAEMVLRLLKDYGNDARLQKNLVAAYVIGWRITKDDLERYPYLNMAQAEADTGVIVSFNSEDANVKNSIFVPKNDYTYGINPLNWTTDSTVASKELNKGACFTSYTGEIKKEEANYTGAYRSAERGTLIMTDINIEEYPSALEIFPDGVYHLYEYQFFYRNLEENVATRTQAFIDND